MSPLNAAWSPDERCSILKYSLNEDIEMIPPMSPLIEGEAGQLPTSTRTGIAQCSHIPSIADAPKHSGHREQVCITMLDKPAQLVSEGHRVV